MAHYRRVGSLPRTRHTQHRDAAGALLHEELMGEEGSPPTPRCSTTGGSPRW